MSPVREFLRGVGLSGWAVVIGLLVLIAVLGKCSWDAGQARRADEARNQANARTAGVAARAGDRADLERVTDTATINNREKALTDAVSAHPDARPSDRRRALACERLRQQGDRDAAISAGC